MRAPADCTIEIRVKSSTGICTANEIQLNIVGDELGSRRFQTILVGSFIEFGKLLVGQPL